MAMRDTIKQYKEALGRTIQSMESYEERGELGEVGTTIYIRFTDQTELKLLVSAHTEVTAEIVPARKKPQRVHTEGAKSRTATA